MATLCRDCRIHLQDSVPQVFRDMRTADPFEPCQLCGDTSLSGDSKDCPQAIIERSYVDIGDNTRLILTTVSGSYRYSSEVHLDEADNFLLLSAHQAPFRVFRGVALCNYDPDTEPPGIDQALDNMNQTCERMASSLGVPAAVTAGTTASSYSNAPAVADPSPEQVLEPWAEYGRTAARRMRSSCRVWEEMALNCLQDLSELVEQFRDENYGRSPNVLVLRRDWTIRVGCRGGEDIYIYSPRQTVLVHTLIDNDVLLPTFLNLPHVIDYVPSRLRRSQAIRNNSRQRNTGYPADELAHISQEVMSAMSETLQDRSLRTHIRNATTNQLSVPPVTPAVSEVLPETEPKSKVSVVRRQLVQPQQPGGAR